MEWFVENALPSTDAAADPRTNLVNRDDLADLPPTTIVLAQIDPLHSEGEMLGERPTEAGVDTETRTFEVVTYEFFGKGAVVPEGNEAAGFAAERLMAGFGAAEEGEGAVPTPAPAQ